MASAYEECREQYVSLRRSAAYLDEHMEAVFPFAEKAKRLIFIGCGSGFTIAKSLAKAALFLLDKPAVAAPAGEILLHADKYANVFEGACVVILTRSGSTSELMLAVDMIKGYTKEFSVVSFICKDGTEAEKISDAALIMPWGFDEAVCQTRCVSTLYFSGMYFLAELSGNPEMKADLLAVANDGEAYMDRIEPVLRKASELPWTNAITLGDAELSGICEEGALAFKEICQLPSNFYHLLDFRHGPIVMARENTIMIAAMSDISSSLEKDLISDCVKKGGPVIVYSDTPVEIDGLYSNITFGRSLCQAARGLAFILICQFLSCFKAAALGVDDEPEGLDPWIKLS